MAKKVPCKGCGELCWPSMHRGAPAAPTCRQCRAAEVSHGTVVAYKYRGCRCADCRAAWNAECARYRKPKVKVERSCDQCGAVFNPRANQVRCSAACMRSWRAANKAARRGASEVSPEDPRVIYDRDGWLCGICELPVDRALRYPDPGSASLDHVKPIALGGAHAENNVQLAHFYCNTVKGARADGVVAC